MAPIEMIVLVIYFQLLSTKTDLNRQKLFNGRHLYPFRLYVDLIIFLQIEIKGSRMQIILQKNDLLK